MNMIQRGAQALYNMLFRSPGEGADTTPLDELDLGRYLGTWFETARYDNIFERGMSDVSAVYERQEDGSIRVTNSGVRKDGRRRSVQGTATQEKDAPAGELQVSFVPPHMLFSTAYRILHVTDGYRGALVSNKNGSILWLLQRREGGWPEVERELLSEAVRRGFDTGKLLYGKPRE